MTDRQSFRHTAAMGTRLFGSNLIDMEAGLRMRKVPHRSSRLGTFREISIIISSEIWPLLMIKSCRFSGRGGRFHHQKSQEFLTSRSYSSKTILYTASLS